MKTGRPRFLSSQRVRFSLLGYFRELHFSLCGGWLGLGTGLQRERLEVAARRPRLLCPSAAGLRGRCIINGATRTGDSSDMQAWPEDALRTKLPPPARKKPLLSFVAYCILETLLLCPFSISLCLCLLLALTFSSPVLLILTSFSFVTSILLCTSSLFFIYSLSFFLFTHPGQPSPSPCLFLSFSRFLSVHFTYCFCLWLVYVCMCERVRKRKRKI